MKVILVNERYGHTRTIVLKGWLKGLLSVCLLGTPVALGYLGFQLAVSMDGQPYSQAAVQDAAFEVLAERAQQVQDRSHQLEQLGQLMTAELLAVAGSAGPSSDAHLDFHIYSNGRIIDPASYLHRTVR